jgi:catechol 2,3-dioxygenase-like lactoylglutathione lyase family enzyme
MLFCGMSWSFAEPVEPFPDSYRAARDAGWAEAVIRVEDPTSIIAFSEQVGGWRVRHPAVSQWWITDETQGVGALRILKAPSEQARGAPPDEPWTAGGLFSVMTRSNDAQRAYRAALDLGWSAVAPPVSLNFSGLSLVNVILRSPDHIYVSVYERLSPRLADAADLDQLRRPFNSMQVVQDLQRARRFYEQTLGFTVIAAGRFQLPADSPSNFGVPQGLAGSVPLDYLIVGPSATGPTQIEVVSFLGLSQGVSRELKHLQFGLIALRFPVSSLQSVQAKLTAAHYPYQCDTVSMPPFGTVERLTVHSPEGARLEFFEVP